MNAERVINKKRKTLNAITKGMVAGAFACLSYGANAEIVGYQGNDSNAQPVKASADKKFTNAKTNLAIAVSTGLERVIRLTVTDSSDRDVFTRTTDIVGGTDRFSFENKQYYGKTIELNSLSDGEYRVTAEILDTAGNVVGWWSSKAGREAVESADANGAFTYTHEVSAPASAESAHIAFHGPYSPDGVPSDGTIQISNARLERLNKPAD